MATPPGDRCCKSQDSVKQRSIFSNYGNAEAQAYQQGRSSYPPALYDKFLSYHRSMGGLSALLLDVVAAPAKLLETSLASSTRLLDVLRARYHVAGAEHVLDLKVIRPGSVDLITAGTAAQRLNIRLFWEQAAKLLRPGGTVALWTVTSGCCHPSTPNAHEAQAILWELEHVTFRPFEPPPLQLAREPYDPLPLSWTVVPPIEGFSESHYLRHGWNREGEVDPVEHFFNATPPYTLSLVQLKSALKTASMTKKRRDAHSELADTSEDCIKMAIGRLRAALGTAEGFEHGGGAVLLLFKGL